MAETIFSKIIKGEIPAHKIYEDDRTLAFLDINPLMDGHILVISKLEVDQFDDLPDEYYQALFATVRLVAKRIKEVYGVKRAGVLIEGHGVAHAHIHVFPLEASIDFYESIERHLEGIRSKKSLPSPDHKKLAEVAAKLAF